MKNLNGTEKQNKYAIDIINQLGGLDKIVDGERKDLFINFASAKFIINNKNLHLDAMINMFVEHNDEGFEGISIVDCFGIEADSDEFFEKQEELDDTIQARKVYL